MTQDDLKLVLEALKWCHGGEPCGTAEAIVIVKEALAQEQEPDYKLLFDEFSEKFALLRDEAEMWKKQALFRFDATATPPQRTWVGLTKKEVHDLYDSDYVVFHQRIEAKLKEKNT